MTKSARDAVEAHMNAINQLDDEAIIASQNFPCVHIWPDGKTDYVATRDDFEPHDWDSILGSDWHHTVLDSAEEITRGSEAVSFRVTFSRRRADKSVIGSYEAIWIATNTGNGWGIQFRHGALEL